MSRDYQRSKVYAAEDHLFNKRLPAEFKTVDQCIEYGNTIVASDYWTSQNGLKRFIIKPGKGCRWATYRQGYGRDTYVLPCWSRSRWLMIHEFSHGLTRRTHGNDIASHGTVFCTHYLNLVRELLGEETAKHLIMSFDRHGVRYIIDKLVA